MFRISSLFVIWNLLFVICFATPPEKFPPISGEIYGQAVSGVKSISVNGKPVAIDPNFNFRSQVNLKAGEKYVNLTIDYGSLKIIKKYMIIRKPRIKKFRVFVPKEKLPKPEKEAVISKPVKRKTARARQPAALKPKPPLVYKYLYVWEFDKGKLLVVKKIQGKYSAEIYNQQTKEWKGIDELRDSNRP